MHIETTHEDYSVLFIVVLNLVGIAAVLDNMKVLIFCEFGLKTPIHAPKIEVFGGFDSLSRKQYSRDQQKALMVAKSRCLSH